MELGGDKEAMHSEQTSIQPTQLQPEALRTFAVGRTVVLFDFKSDEVYVVCSKGPSMTAGGHYVPITNKFE
jgi:hypothetical protein